LNVLHNYFDGPKLFLDLYSSKFLDSSAKAFFSVNLSKSKLVKLHWFQCYTYNYINQWYVHCLSVIIHWFWLVKVLSS